MGNTSSSSSCTAPSDDNGGGGKRSGSGKSSKKDKHHHSQHHPPAANNMASRALAGIQSGIAQLEENDHPAAQLLDSMCGPYLDHATTATVSSSSSSQQGHNSKSKTSNSGANKKGKKGSKSRYYEEDEDDGVEEEESVEDEETEYSGTQVTLSEDETSYLRRRGGRRGVGDNETVESASYFESDYDNSTMPGNRSSRMTGDESSYDETTTDGEHSTRQFSGVVTQVEEIGSHHHHHHHRSGGSSGHHHHHGGNKQPLASAFAKRCYFTKSGIGKTTQHYEGLTLTGNVVLMLAAAMKLKGCPTICDEDLRRVEQTYPNQFSRLPDELLLSSGWRRISKYCHFSNKPIPDGVPFFHSKQRLHPTGGYYFLLAAAVGMVRPLDVEPLNRDTLVLLETDFPTACDNAPPVLIQDPTEWTLVDKFCFFSGGPINTDEDVYYQADFEGSAIYMLAFLSPSLTPAELYKLETVGGLETVAAVQEVESVYDLTERDFDDLKLYHLGPCRALPQYILQPQAWTKVLPPHFLEAREQALVRAKDYDPNIQFAQSAMPYGGEPQPLMIAAEEANYYSPAFAAQQFIAAGGVPVPTPQGLRAASMGTMGMPPPPPPQHSPQLAAAAAARASPPMMMMPPAGPHPNAAAAATTTMMAPSPPAEPQRMMMTMMPTPPPPPPPPQMQLQQQQPIHQHAPIPLQQQLQQPPPQQQPISSVDPPADAMRMEMQRQVEEEGAFAPNTLAAVAAAAAVVPTTAEPSISAAAAEPEVEGAFPPNSFSAPGDENQISATSFRDSPSIGIDPPESTILAEDDDDDDDEEEVEDEPPSLSKHQLQYADEKEEHTNIVMDDDDEDAPSDEPPSVLNAERNLDNVAPPSVASTPTSSQLVDYLNPKHPNEEDFHEKENPSSPLRETNFSFGTATTSPPPSLAIDPQASVSMYSESVSEFAKTPTDNLPPRSPSSEYSQSSAMKGAQEMLRRNRQRRLLDAARKKREVTAAERPEVERTSVAEEDVPGPLSPQSEVGSSATWETSSEMSGGSSIWTDHTNTNQDRSSRRALILQMARTRMRKSNHAKVAEKEQDADEPPSIEEEKKVDSMRDGSDIDLTGELD